MEYWQKIESMDRTKLDAEIKRLTQQLFSIPGTSPIKNQILDMLDIAHQTKQEHFFKDQIKSNNSADVINIGEVDSVSYTPNYNTDELLTAIVTLYQR
jgi:hypothetical protein